MIVSVKRAKYGKKNIGSIPAGKTFAGAKSGKWFLMCNNRTFVHLETGKVTQLTPRIARQACHPVDAIVLRGGEVAASRR